MLRVLELWVDQRLLVVGPLSGCPSKRNGVTAQSVVDGHHKRAGKCTRALLACPAPCSFRAPTRDPTVPTQRGVHMAGVSKALKAVAPAIAIAGATSVAMVGIAERSSRGRDTACRDNLSSIRGFSGHHIGDGVRA